MIESYEIVDRQLWLQWRASVLTASDIGAAAGLDKYKSPLALWAEKTGLIPAGIENKMMRRGRWFEPAVLAAIREEYPDWDVQKATVFLCDHDRRLGATPDAVAVTDQPGLTNIQMKVVAKPEFDRSWADGPPLAYQLQTACETMLMDVERGMVAALVLDAYVAELHLFPVPRLAAVERRIEMIAASFWDALDHHRQPKPLFDRDAETVAAMYPASTPGEVLDLTGDNHLPEVLAERAVLKDQIKEAETRVGEIDTEIKAKLGTAERAELDGWKLSFKSQDRKQVTIPASSFRVLRVTQLEEAKA